MPKRKLPKASANEWFDTGAHIGFDDLQSLDEAIAERKPPEDALEAFTRGYLRGRIGDPLQDFRFWMKYLDTEQLRRLGNELHKLRDQFDEELSRDDAAYKVNGLFDQYD